MAGNEAPRSPLSVTFDPSERRSRRALVRDFYPDTAGTLLWIVFGMVVHVIAGWMIAFALSAAFDFDSRERDGIVTLFLVILLTVSWWQQWSQGPGGATSRHGRLIMTLEAEGILLSCVAYELRCRWAAIDRITVRKDHLVVIYPGTRGVAISEEAFGGREALLAFAEAASAMKRGSTPLV